MVIEKGKKVKIEYQGSLDNGQVFDSSEGKEPLEFTLGEGKIIPGFENAVMEMNKGEEKTIKIPAKDAYGEKDPNNVQKLPKSEIPDNIRGKIVPGIMLAMQAPNGEKVPLIVSAVDEDSITLDLNHHLAGQDLNFKIKVVDVQ